MGNLMRTLPKKAYSPEHNQTFRQNLLDKIEPKSSIKRKFITRQESFKNNVKI